MSKESIKCSKCDETVSYEETNEIQMKFSSNEWHIMPQAFGGSKRSGTIAVILGTLIIIAAIYFWPVAIIGAGAGAAASTMIYTAAIGVGLGLGITMTGLSTLLSPSPQISDYSQRDVRIRKENEEKIIDDVHKSEFDDDFEFDDIDF